jgi:RNA polymerase sigma factor (sigma-70 family)
LHDADDERAARWEMLLPHRELALGMVLRATGNLAEAEDCVHDAMLRLVRRSDLDPARVRALLVRASLHIAIDHRRAATRQQTAVIRLGGGAAAEVVSPEQVVAQRAEVARVVAALDSLPRREREVMLLRLSGLNVAETAARMGISYKSVEGSYTRGRARMRHLLAVVVAGVVERLRRAASPGGEMAATTVAALLLLGGPGAGGAAAGEQPTDLPRGGAHRPVPLAVASTPPPTVSAPNAPEPEQPPGTTPRPRPPRTLAPHLRLPTWQPGSPHPDATVDAPIEAPFGLGAAGVYVVLHPWDAATDPAASATLLAPPRR